MGQDQEGLYILPLSRCLTCQGKNSIFLKNLKLSGLNFYLHDISDYSEDRKNPYVMEASLRIIQNSKQII